MAMAVADASLRRRPLDVRHRSRRMGGAYTVRRTAILALSRNPVDSRYRRDDRCPEKQKHLSHLAKHKGRSIAIVLDIIGVKQHRV
jgi:hypothetical protein